MNDKELQPPTAADMGKVAEIIRSLKDLVASAGWKYYISIVEEQTEVRQNDILLRPLQSLDEALSQEFAKGEVASLKMVGHLPHQMIDDFSVQLEAWKSQQPEGDDNEHQ